MTVTRLRILSWATNDSIIAVLPEIAKFSEEVMEEHRRADTAGGCSGCDIGSDPRFMELGDKGIDLLNSLSDDAIKRLKAFLRERSLTFYVKDHSTGENRKITR